MFLSWEKQLQWHCLRSEKKKKQEEGKQNRASERLPVLRLLDMAWVTAPRTPIRNGQELHQLIESLNEQFALDLPNPHVYSPSVERRNEESPRWRSYNGIKRLYYSRKVDLNVVLNNLEEWIAAQEVSYTNAPRNGGAGAGWNVSDAMGR